MKIDLYVHMYGNHFSPAQVEARTGLSLVEKSEAGDLGETGKYRGKPLPYGSGTLRLLQPDSHYGPQMEALLLALDAHSKIIRDCGAESVVLWFIIFADRDEQCNIEFSPAEMARLSGSGATLAVSYY